MSTQEVPKKRDMDWVHVLYCIHLQVLALYGLWLLVFEAKWMTIFFTFFIITLAFIGLTVGAHRLWAHQSFKASWHVRLFLMLAHTLAGVGPIHEWVVSHRLHHAYYGTEKDPYNHNKGFWYSHVFSNLVTPHSDREELEKSVDTRDLMDDLIIITQRRLYWVLFIIIGLLLPINAPAEYWDESLINSVFILGFLRLAICLNISWLINSAVLIWGLKPGDKFPVGDNSVFFVAKSYWPNYHYMISWDWKSGEFGTYDAGLGTFFIKICYELGQVNCMKTASSEDIRNALYKVATSKMTLKQSLNEVEVLAVEEALKMKLRYYH